MAKKTWPFDTPANYTYDSAKIEISGGLVKLKKASWANIYANWHLNESAGAVAVDSSGNGRNGALVNMENEDWKPGKLSNCLEFDGLNEEVNFGDIADFERTDAFSLEVWFKTGAITNQDLFNRMMPVQPFTGWIIYMSAGGIQVFLVNSIAGGNYVQVNVNENFADSAWHHVVVTYDGSSTAAGVHVYIDGNDKTLAIPRDALNASIRNTEDCRLAARDRPLYHFEGMIDEVVIYDKELSQAEVTARWNMGDGIEQIPGDTYPTDKPTIRPVDSWQSLGLIQLTAFDETLGGDNEGSVRYQLSGDDGVTWLFWNGAAWALAGADDYNDAATIQTNVGTFLVDSDKIVFRAFLISDGAQEVELDEIEVTAKKLIDVVQIIAGKVTLIKIETDKIQTQIIDQRDEFKADISALPSAEEIQIITENIQFLKDLEAGCWEIKDNQMIFYTYDNDMEELIRFNLTDKDGKPAEKNVYKRCRA